MSTVTTHRIVESRLTAIHDAKSLGDLDVLPAQCTKMCISGIFAAQESVILALFEQLIYQWRNKQLNGTIQSIC